MVTAVQEVGSCNTQLTAKTRRPQLAERGIDTWRLIRRFGNDRDLRRAEELALERDSRSAIDGHRWGFVSGRQLLWIEGHPSVDGLAAPGDLAGCEERVLEQLGDTGCPLGEQRGIGRLDFTATIRYEDPRDGLALLTAVAHLDVPRCKPEVIGRPVETVYLLSEVAGRKLARVYDKGRQAGIEAPGKLIRFEDQRRWSGETRISTEVLRENAEQMSRLYFTSRFAPVALSSEGVTVATADVLAARMRELMASGRVSYSKGYRLLGFLVAGSGGELPDRTRREWRRDLRELGLVLADPMDDDLVVDVAAGVETALAAWESESA